MINKICTICGKEYRVFPYRFKNSKYCSKKCWNKRNLPDKKICEFCQKSFKTYMRNQRFCSRSCARKGTRSNAFKDGKSMIRERARFSNELKKWRDAVFKRDNYTCQKCGKKKELHAHHIKSFSKYPKLRFNIDNGITYCIEHHGKIHNKNFLPKRRPKICIDCGKQTKGRSLYCRSCAMIRWHASITFQAFNKTIQR